MKCLTTYDMILPFFYTSMEGRRLKTRSKASHWRAYNPPHRDSPVIRPGGMYLALVDLTTPLSYLVVRLHPKSNKGAQRSADACLARLRLCSRSYVVCKPCGRSVKDRTPHFHRFSASGAGNRNHLSFDCEVLVLRTMSPV